MATSTNRLKRKTSAIKSTQIELLNRKIQTFSESSTPKNTERAYISDLDCFLEWGGKLPSTPIGVAQYLAAHAHVHRVGTLRRRKSMISKWHRKEKLEDPTTDLVVKETMAGISRLYNAPVRKKKPLSINQLNKIVRHLESVIGDNYVGSTHRRKALRDRAMITVGFWGCLRSDELVSLKVKDLQLTQHSLKVFNAHTKTDKANLGRQKTLKSLPQLCPVEAVRAYLAEEAPKNNLFPSLTPKGELGTEAIKSKSILDWLVRLCSNAKVRKTNIGSHSLRRGFATWYAESGDIWGLMAAGDWKNAEVASGYVESSLDIKMIRKRLKQRIR